MKRLVLIHGRAQQDKDPGELKRVWIEAWRRGLQKTGLELPLPESRIRLAYYGDTLRDMCDGMSEADAAKIVVRGATTAAGADGMLDMLEEYRQALQIDDAAVEQEQRALEPGRVIEKGPQNWGWVQAVIRLLDRRTTAGAGALLALLVNDVHQYLSNDSIRLRIEDGVADAFDAQDDNIVVSHSLGSLVAYRLMHGLATERGWRVPLLVTLGSPLGVRALRKRLNPIRRPPGLNGWFNARDPRDVVALYPLDATHFPVTPGIVNKSDVDNATDNRHGITGYLDDPAVARVLHDAVQGRNLGEPDDTRVQG
ncbi:hypothetical protein FOZ76_02695 [Verticiella sediminum]|uniref:Alpha/beta hydrolase n=1 Tax=Verticiella sediminum TaxID=1247510 RepID=A0A556B0H7_9BURK|nr:hypothetical protein [Verticiella sediminum]TSH98672.1 hypothetical protein FOZ76_02695 [Verticiella sediminum]